MKKRSTIEKVKMETNTLQSVATIECFVQTEFITLKLIRFTRKDLIHLACISLYIKVAKESYDSNISLSRMFNREQSQKEYEMNSYFCSKFSCLLVFTSVHTTES